MATIEAKTGRKAPRIKTEKGNMPFEVKDCALISRMAGLDTAINLRELRERVKVSPLECLFHHFCETAIRPTFDDPEFHNDFAIWAARELEDIVLAERLGIINPYHFDNLEHLRQLVMDIFDERLAELPEIPRVKKGKDFRFMRAVTVVFDTNVKIEKPDELIDAIKKMNLSSLYYHYVEARRRTKERTDDFTIWLKGFGTGCETVIGALSKVDFYFMSLSELKQQLVKTLVEAEINS
jgi:hypothetical protein